MPTPAYHRDPYLTSLATRILATGHDSDRPYALLEDTILFPEGGGQPADRGWLAGAGAGEVEVVDVQKAEDGARHYLAAAVEPGPVTVRLDWARRFDNMQQHTAQHVLSAISADRFGWRTTAFHLGAVVSDIELDVCAPGATELAALEEAVAAEIRAARPVTDRRVTPEEYAALPKVRSRGLPAGHTGDVRLVEIAGVDLATCGGTHVRSTAELEGLKLLDTEALRGGIRLFWVAGGRLRRRLAAHEARNAELRSALNTSDEELAAVAALKLAQLKDAARRERALSDQLADLLVQAMAAAPGALVERHVEGGDAGLLQLVARRFSALAHDKLAFVTATGAKGTAFALAAGEASPADVPALGREMAEALGGRGGGSGRTFQGQAPSLARRAEAFALLSSRLAG